MNQQVKIGHSLHAPKCTENLRFFFSLVGTTNEGVLKQYYYDAYGRIRRFSDCLLTVAPLLYQQGPDQSDWVHFMSPPKFHRIRQEWHRYQIWGYEVI